MFSKEDKLVEQSNTGVDSLAPAHPSQPDEDSTASNEPGSGSPESEASSHTIERPSPDADPGPSRVTMSTPALDTLEGVKVLGDSVLGNLERARQDLETRQQVVDTETEHAAKHRLELDAEGTQLAKEYSKLQARQQMYDAKQRRQKEIDAKVQEAILHLEEGKRQFGKLTTMVSLALFFPNSDQQLICIAGY